MSIEIEYLGAEHYQASSDSRYIDVFKLHDLFDAIAYKANVVTVGPKGIGKSLSFHSWAAKNKVPIITFDCSEDVRRRHLIGTFFLRGDSTPFVLGALTSAIQIANDVGKCVLVLEELNSLTPQMQKVLNSVTDWRKKIEVPEAKAVFELKEGAELWITGTMNNSIYGGVYQLNEDLKSRLRLLPLSYPTEKQERVVLEESLTTRPNKKLLTQVLTLGSETRQGSTDYALSTRDLVQILEDIPSAGIQRALWMASGKFEDADRGYFHQRVLSLFEIQL